MDEKKPESIQKLMDEQAEKVTGGADFAKYKAYLITCNDCG